MAVCHWRLTSGHCTSIIRRQKADAEMAPDSAGAPKWQGLRYRLSPIEQVSGNLERTELANLCLDTIGEAAENVDESLCHIDNETRLALSFLRHCGLKL